MGTEGEAHRQIALAGRGTGQEQAREVGAAEHEQDADDAQRHLHRLAVPVPELRQTRP